ncbi:MAG: 30S ribosomal protein S2 [Chitinophagales bacterium]|nr:30S ribosomal protein S2 [Chitinophagales bacterium]MDW8427186.1 30S ribosomal protein S2 [Chitinophagales bacterium]
MEAITYQQLLEAGVHFGHLRRKWCPRMAPYIFMERKGIHIIDLNKTLECLNEAAAALKQVSRSGKNILFVATKKQAKQIVREAAQRAGMPYVTERWLGGMLTNFATIRKSIKKLQNIENMLDENAQVSITKKERLRLSREKAKMEKVLSGVASLNRLPAAVYIVDIMHENIALAEARRLGILTVAMVDTNSDPTLVDFPIPANDDATKSISIITNYLADAVIEGVAERQQDREEVEGVEEAESATVLSSLDLGDEETPRHGERRKSGRRTSGRGIKG